MERMYAQMIKVIVTLLFIGSFLAFGMGTLGLFKFKDPYTRMHGVSIGDTLGVALLVMSFLILSPSWILRLKIIFISLLFWIINTSMTHLVAKAAVMSGTKANENTTVRKE